MNQVRISKEKLSLIFLQAGLIEGKDGIFNITVEKNGDVIFNIISDIENILLHLPLTDVGLSKKTTKPLWMTRRFPTLNDVVRCKESELLRVVNFGPTALKELQIFLIQNGLQLEEE